jgi:hypothetical protein
MAHEYVFGHGIMNYLEWSGFDGKNHYSKQAIWQRRQRDWGKAGQ